MGKNETAFNVLKFATMLKNSPNMAGANVTKRDDPRVLPFGRFLRITKINELPQLINVVIGDMSIVGPRPLTNEAFSLYRDDLKPLIYQSRPGITGLGSVVFRHEETILAKSSKPRNQCYREDILPVKGALEVWYLQHKCLLVDIKIIVLTFLALFSTDNRLCLKWFKDLPINEADLDFDAETICIPEGSQL